MVIKTPKYCLYNTVKKDEKTVFGVISFENVLFNPLFFENYVIDSILTKENLELVFQSSAK
jgi:hypothetical protein